MLEDPWCDGGGDAAVDRSSEGDGRGRFLAHGLHCYLAGGLYAALGVGGPAGVAPGVLGEDLRDDDGGHAVLVLDLHGGGGGEGSAVFGPGHLGVGVALHRHPQLHGRAVGYALLRLETRDKAGRAHEGIVWGQGELLGGRAGAGATAASGGVGAAVGLLGLLASSSSELAVHRVVVDLHGRRGVHHALGMVQEALIWIRKENMRDISHEM